MSEKKFKISESTKAKLYKLIRSPYILVLPAALFYLAFWAYPVLTAIFEVFTKTEVEGGGFTFQNILNVIGQPDFFEALRNSLVFAVISIVLQFVLALALALLINRKFKGSSIFLFLMMLPMAVPIASVGVIWNTGLLGKGWINSILYSTGIQTLLENIGLLDGFINWTSATDLKAVLFLILIDTWTVLPSVMIIILAGLQNLNKEYQEASLVFGATKRQSITDIIIPIIKPTIITSLLLRIISGIQVWLISVMIFDYGKPPFLVERIVFYSRHFYTEEYDKIALTYSLIVVLIVMSIAYLFLRASRESERSLR